MSRNHGVGQRRMRRAGNVLLQTRHHGSYKTIYTHSYRFDLFCDWAEREHGVKKLEAVTFELVVTYGRHLQAIYEAGGSASTSSAKNRVSSVNVVMRLAIGGKWRAVHPGRDCGISPRKYIAKESRAMPEAAHEAAIAKVGQRLAAMMGLQREFGLRFEESALINPKIALRQAVTKGYIVVADGTKGGKKRKVPCRAGAIPTLERAIAAKDGRSMVPKNSDYFPFRTECYALAKMAGIKFHDERHHYANERYTEETGAPTPVHAGWGRRERIIRLAEYLGVSTEEARGVDKAARLKIAKELGHEREQITNAYIG